MNTHVLRTRKVPAPSSERPAAPSLEAAWGGDLLDAAEVRPGDRVLEMDWQMGHAADLPFPDASFDVVVCHQKVQLFPDRSRALAEMHRILAQGGRVAVSAWGPIDRNPAFAALADSLERRAGVQVASGVRWLYSLPEPRDLRALLAFAGFGGIRVRTAARATPFPSVAEFVRRYIPKSSAASITEDGRLEVIGDLERRLAPWLGADGLTILTEANTASARR